MDRVPPVTTCYVSKLIVAAVACNPQAPYITLHGLVSCPGLGYAATERCLVVGCSVAFFTAVGLAVDN
jgi:hypothetical protein